MRCSECKNTLEYVRGMGSARDHGGGTYRNLPDFLRVY